MDEDDIDAMVREVTDSIRRGPYDAALRGVHDMLTIPVQMESELAAANTRIAELTAAVERMREALAPFAFFAERWEANPLGRIADDFYTIHGGMEDKEASIRLSDCKKARAALGAP